MKFASLGSGSEGNALLISASSGATRTTVMLDCGFGIRETERRLAKLGMEPQNLCGIVVTHEHTDHVSGVFKFARRHGLPVWLTYGTYRAVEHDCNNVAVHFCRDGEVFAIGDLQLMPYTVPHDAREPVQYIASNGQFRLGVLTDAGQSTPHLVQALSGCDALMLECNHDRQMLLDSAYPQSLKQRIGGPYGHLSNQAAAEILEALDQRHLKKLVGAHLSLKNNTPDLAYASLSGALKVSHADIMIACQEDGFAWIGLSA